MVGLDVVHVNTGRLADKQFFTGSSGAPGEPRNNEPYLPRQDLPSRLAEHVSPVGKSNRFVPEIVDTSAAGKTRGRLSESDC